ncbi:MAG: LysR family transcriptional regulator substrate-binding protein [Propionicimonas sp.]
MQMPEPHGAALRVGYVPGVTLTKWRTIWAERFPRQRLDVVEIDQDDQRRALTAAEVDLCFVRLPINTDQLHLIQLYEELPVAWAAKDHLIAAADQITLADLATETVVTTLTPFHIDLVTAGEAVLLVPQSVARTHSRRDLIYRVITDAPSTTVGLAWLKDNPQELIDEFIGVVRGRTANSARSAQERAAKGRPAKPAKAKAAPKPSAKPSPRRRGRR